MYEEYIMRLVYHHAYCILVAMYLWSIVLYQGVTTASNTPWLYVCSYEYMECGVVCLWLYIYGVWCCTFVVMRLWSVVRVYRHS